MFYLGRLYRICTCILDQIQRRSVLFTTIIRYFHLNIGPNTRAVCSIWDAIYHMCSLHQMQRKCLQLYVNFSANWNKHIRLFASLLLCALFTFSSYMFDGIRYTNCHTYFLVKRDILLPGNAKYWWSWHYRELMTFMMMNRSNIVRHRHRRSSHQYSHIPTSHS